MEQEKDYMWTQTDELV